MHIGSFFYLFDRVCIVYQMCIINSAIYVRFNQELFMYFTPFYLSGGVWKMCV